MNFSIIDEYFGKLIVAIQDYGWYLVFLGIFWYMLQPTLEEWRRKRSLAQALDPERVRLLDAERKRVRAKQALAQKTD